MARFEEGIVTGVTVRGDAVYASVEMADGSVLACMGWGSMLGEVGEGDRVVVNVVGIELGLGTGGEGFLLWNLSGPGPQGDAPGHIVKLRYTPWQKPVLVAEAPESSSHASLLGRVGLGGTPVVACGLHSQVAGVAAGVKAAAPAARVGYLMTDGGALPAMWSRLLGSLREAGLVDVTATSGHSFGGDVEVVNIFSGLEVLKVTEGVDVIVAGMGPGVVGTGTELGTTALEQGQILDAAGALDARPIAALRISFSEERTRHRGVSHHALTALTVAARARATVVVPELPPDRTETVLGQLHAAGVDERHDIVVAPGEPGIALLRSRGITPSSMGRPFEDCPELFAAAAAAGHLAGEWAL